MALRNLRYCPSPRHDLTQVHWLGWQRRGYRDGIWTRLGRLDDRLVPQHNLRGGAATITADDRVYGGAVGREWQENASVEQCPVRSVEGATQGDWLLLLNSTLICARHICKQAGPGEIQQRTPGQVSSDLTP